MWKNEVIIAHLTKQTKNKKHNVEKCVKWIQISIPIDAVTMILIVLYQGQKHISNLTLLDKVPALIISLMA